MESEPIWTADLDEHTRFEYWYATDDGGLAGALHLDDGSIVEMDLTKDQGRSLYEVLKTIYGIEES